MVTETETAVDSLREAGVLIAVVLILMYVIPGQYCLFACLMAWQYVHMYIIGRKDITFGNFDGLDLLAGIPVLYFFFTCPATYFLSIGLWYMMCGSSRRSE